MGQTGRLCQEFFFLFGVPEVRRIDNGTEGKTPPPGEAWWVVRLSPRSLPIVLLKMPWQDGQQVSTTGNLGPAVAEVYGTSSCPIPNWTWNWVLTQAGVILAVLQTSVCLVFGKMLGNTFSFFLHHFNAVKWCTSTLLILRADQAVLGDFVYSLHYRIQTGSDLTKTVLHVFISGFLR